MQTNGVQIENTPNIIVITDSDANQITVTQPITSVIEVGAVGPQGPKGLPGDNIFTLVSASTYATTSSLIVTGSLTVSGSSTFTNIGPAIFSGSVTSTQGFTGSLFGTSSYAITASYALNGGSGGGGFYIATGSVSASVSLGTGSFTITSGSSNFLFVSSSGNVGIGTTTPIYKLDVNGTARATTLILGNYTASANPNVFTIQNPNGGSGRVIIYGGSTSQANILINGSSGGNSNQIQFNLGSTVQNLFFSNGNLGLNTTTDAGFKLDVNGTGRFSGNLTVSGSATNSLLVRGSGTTSSTTSLLVQNSAGTQLGYVDDSGQWIFGTGTSIVQGIILKPASMEINLSQGSGVKIRIAREGNDSLTFATNGSLFAGNLSTAGLLIGGANANIKDDSAMLQVQSTTRGFLPPRTNLLSNISSPSQGLQTYITSSATEGIWYYNSGLYQGWTRVLNNSGSQVISGSLELTSALTASNAIISGNVTVLGTASINTLIVNQTQLSTGSNQLGDAVDDFQTLYGTVVIPTGSLTVTGSITQTASTASFGGVVGIGTSSPAYKLDVNGTAKITTLGIDGFDTVYNQKLYVNGNIRIQDGGGVGNTNTTTGEWIKFSSVTGVTLGTNTSERVRITTTGNTLIGTTTDSGFKLDVVGTGRFSSYLYVNGGAGSGLATSSTNTSLVIWNRNVTTSGDGILLGNGFNALGGTNINLNLVRVPIGTTYTGGTNTTNVVYITPTINNSGGTNILRGIYYDPTLTSLTGTTHRAIETTSGDIIFGGNTAVTITGSLTVVTGSSIEFQVNQTGVKIGNATTDSHAITGSVAITASAGTGSALLIYKSGSTVLDVQGSSGQLFSVTDSLTGSLFSVNTVAGLPVIETFSDNTVNIGKYGTYPIKVVSLGTSAIITGSFSGSLTGVANTASFALTASYVNPLVQNVLISGSLSATANVTFYNSLTTSSYFSTNGISNDGRMALYGTDTNGSIQLLAHRGAFGGGAGALFPGSVSLAGITGAIGYQGSQLAIQSHVIGIGVTNSGTHKSLAIGTPNTAVNTGFGGNTDTVDIGTFSSVSNTWGGTRPSITYTALSHIFKVNTGTGQNNPGTDVLIISSSGYVGIGTTTPTATLQVKGSGTTSSTTALLVQNSSGTESLKVQDDNIVRTTYLGIGGGTSTNNIGGTTIAQFGNAVSSGDQLVVVDSIAGTKRGFKFGNQGTIRMALIQDGVNLQIGSFASTFNPYVTFEYVTGNVGFGTTSTNVSAKVQIDSTTQGFLSPRTNVTSNISSPAQGLQTYITASTTEGLYYYNSGSYQGWTRVLNNSGSQSISGSVIIDGGLFDTTSTGSLATGSTLIYSVDTGSYTAGFFDYYAVSGSNGRAGTVMSFWLGGQVQYTDNSTPDVGNTSNIAFSMSLAGSSAQLFASASSAGWNVKTSFRTF
jgi:hypothetical protein